MTREDAISRRDVLDGLASIAKAKARSDAQKAMMGRTMFFVEQLPPVSTKKPNRCGDLISREETLTAFADYVGSGMSMNDYDALWDIVAKMPSVKTQEPCKDAISRQAAIEAINKAFERVFAWDGTSPLGDKVLENVPSAQPEQRWIPCSERLPETEEFVLASLTGKYRNTTFEHACEIADYADGGWCVYAYPHMSAEKCEELIEAWMPLPQPYKGESER